MSFTQAQLDALKGAYASGVKTVQHDGKMVTYRSFAEMERAIERMEGELNAKPRRQIIRMGSSRGYR